MSVKIPVEATFDTSKVQAQLQQFQQQLNAMGQQIARANKVQYNPVSKTTLDDLRKVTAQFEALKRVSGDLNKRIKTTGQDGMSFLDLDWSKLYPDQASRARQMAKAFQYVTGQGFHTPVPPASQGPAGRRPSVDERSRTSATWAGVGVQVAQAGLRNAGPVGGVAAGALGTGMSAGFGAGLMGLLGGIAALGVGKLVGMAKENIGRAEDNAVAYDKLKRVIGDVNVSFDALKTVIEGAADGVRVTFDEAAKLSSQFAKLGNLTNEQYASLDGELRTGVGLARALGLDPSQTMGFMGSMRGLRQTQDEQGSRRLALLIGETIAKSDAFAKSDEVMDAIAGYVTAQTRTSLNANISGYAGMFSSMVGSGIAGMDPAGAAGILSRINSSLMQGGAKGEASQFATGAVGRRFGLDALQTQLLREAGAFATPDMVFGKGSIYELATGRTGPSGSQTFLAGTDQFITDNYGNNPLLRAQAAANHFGITMTQALALGTMKPNDMGELEKQLAGAGVRISDINMAGLSALAKVMSGTAEERLGVASELWGRTGKDALTDEERRLLNEAMTTGSEQDQKQILAQLIASRDQEITQGKDIRDSKVAVENIKTMMAEQLLPLTQAMRDGIMWMAGGKDGKTALQVQEQLRTLEVNEKYDALVKEQGDRIFDARMSEFQPGDDFHAQQKRMEESRAIQEDANKKIAELEKERERVLREELEKLRARKDAVDSAPSFGVRAAPSGWRAEGGRIRQSISGASGWMDPEFAAEAAAEGLSQEEARLAYSIWTQESSRGANAGTSHAGAQGHMQMMPGTFRAFADKGWDINNPTHNRRAAMRYIRYLNERSGGNLHTTAGAYYGGEKAIGPGGRLKNFGDRRRPDYPTTHEYADEVLGRMSRLPQGEPLPPGGSGGPGTDQRFIFDAAPIEVIHKNARGEPIGVPEMLATRIRPATPFGANREFA